MNKKTAMILIALIGVGLYALPQTASLFSGQHSFVNVDATGNQIECTKCHSDVQVELSSGSNTVTGTAGPHADFKCEYCHRIEQGASSGDNAYGKLTYTEAGAGHGLGLSKVLIVPLTDMESGNVPESILVGDTLTTIGARGLSNKSVKGSFLLSNCLGTTSVSGLTCADPASATIELEVEPSAMTEVATYNPLTGTPKDTNTVTMNSGLDISKMSFNYTIANGKTSETENLTNAGSRAVNPGSKYHAASIISCLECHNKQEPTGHYTRIADGNVNGGKADCSNCHYGGGSAGTGEFGTKMAALWVGGFNLSGDPSDTGSSEAHMKFVKTDDGITRFEYGASNGACISCHSHVKVDITYNKATTYKFDSTLRDTQDVSNFVAGGSTYTYSGGEN